MRRLVVMVVSVALFVGVGASAAFAGEITGNGKVTGAPGHANSECSFSGLEDGSEGTPAGPGNPPQNWGQIPKAERDFLDEHRGEPRQRLQRQQEPAQGLRSPPSCWKPSLRWGLPASSPRRPRGSVHTVQALPGEFPVPAEHGCREVMALELAPGRPFPELLDVLGLMRCHRHERLAPVTQRLDRPATTAPLHQLPISPCVGAILKRKALGCTYAHRDEVAGIGRGIRDRGDAGVRTASSRRARVLDVHAHAASIDLRERKAHKLRYLLVGVAGRVLDHKSASPHCTRAS